DRRLVLGLRAPDRRVLRGDPGRDLLRDQLLDDLAPVAVLRAYARCCHLVAAFRAAATVSCSSDQEASNFETPSSSSTCTTSSYEMPSRSRSSITLRSAA